ncbi:MAG: hypothetical protein KGV46_02625, partial [Pasteurella sp.]|nr:hypothetical protein [Pasteurella sp.]
MEQFLIDLETNIFESLADLLDKVPVIVAGVSLVAVTIMTAWSYYRVLMILLGQSGDAFIPLIKDYLFKAAVVALLVSSASTYKDYVVDNVAGESGVVESLA